MEQISASEVANQFGCTTRAVTKAAVERRLRGQLVAGRWLFHPTMSWHGPRPEQRELTDE